MRRKYQLKEKKCSQQLSLQQQRKTGEGPLDTRVVFVATLCDNGLLELEQLTAALCDQDREYEEDGADGREVCDYRWAETCHFSGR